MKHLKWTLLLAVLLVFTACKKDKTANMKDGIYADIKTNRGEILLNLNFKETPVTVANFVSLAEGKNSFLTIKDLIGKPFFNGIKFHRVIKQFMIQTGDPNSLDSIPENDGTGGPGYNFQDEFPKDSLGKLVFSFNDKGVLAMANAGPNTNGSQFFITHVATPHLDGLHTIFGHVVEGQSVVDTIAQNDSIIKIDIIRKGKDAKAFDANKIFSDAFLAYTKMQNDAYAKAQQITVKEAEAFTAEMEKAGFKINTFDNGLIIAVKKEGKGEKPKSGDLVQVHYAGRLTSGVEFDSSYKKNEPIKFQIGTGRVIRGWDIGIMELAVGAKATLFIPSTLGWGARGAGNVIPPNANIIFDVELIKIGA